MIEQYDRANHTLAMGNVHGCPVCVGWCPPTGNPAHLDRLREERIVRAVAAMMASEAWELWRRGDRGSQQVTEGLLIEAGFRALNPRPPEEPRP